LIEQLIALIDGLKLNASAVRRKIDEDFERFSRFAANVLGMDEQKAKKINQRECVEYVLRNGTMEEKRGLLGSLKNKLILRNGRVEHYMGSRRNNCSLTLQKIPLTLPPHPLPLSRIRGRGELRFTSE